MVAGVVHETIDPGREQVAAWGPVGAAVFDRAHPGVWSSGARYLWPGPTTVADFPLGGRNIALVSPSGAITTQVTNSELTVVDRDNPGRYFFANMAMGLHLIEGARKHGVKKFLQTGTICAYPNLTPVPTNRIGILPVSFSLKLTLPFSRTHFRTLSCRTTR